jgi:hypothetical protein
MLLLPPRPALPCTRACTCACAAAGPAMGTCMGAARAGSKHACKPPMTHARARLAPDPRAPPLPPPPSCSCRQGERGRPGRWRQDQQGVGGLSCWAGWGTGPGMAELPCQRPQQQRRPARPPACLPCSIPPLLPAACLQGMTDTKNAASEQLESAKHSAQETQHKAEVGCRAGACMHAQALPALAWPTWPPRTRGACARLPVPCP